MATNSDAIIGISVFTGAIVGAAITVVAAISVESKKRLEQTEYCAAVMAGAIQDEKEWCPIGSYGIYYNEPAAAGDLSNSCGPNLENCK